MNRFLAGTVCMTVCLTVTSSADAQMVRVGPFGGVRIRAPFVSIDTLPFGGGARVRAPFTAVDTRLFASPYSSYRYGYRYGVPTYPVAPVYPAPVYTTPSYPQTTYPPSSYPQPGNYQAARPSVPVADLPRRLRAAAQQLKRSLSLRRNDADVWIDYLDPDRIIATLDQGGAPTALRDLLQNYDGVVGNNSLASIRASAGFSETHLLLRQLVTTPQAPRGGSAAAEPNAVPVPAPRSEPTVPTPAEPVRPADVDRPGTPEALPIPPEPTPL